MHMYLPRSTYLFSLASSSIRPRDAAMLVCENVPTPMSQKTGIHWTLTYRLYPSILATDGKPSNERTYSWTPAAAGFPASCNCPPFLSSVGFVAGEGAGWGAFQDNLFGSVVDEKNNSI